jgi:hypothetical protein
MVPSKNLPSRGSGAFSRAPGVFWSVSGVFWRVSAAFWVVSGARMAPTPWPNCPAAEPR